MDTTALLICNRVLLFKNSLQSCSHRPCMALRPSVAPRALQAFARKSVSVPDQLKLKNLYEVLEISPATTAKAIKRAYRKLARDFHPDHVASPQEKNESTQMFLRIHNAYATLSDPCDRAQNDRQILARMQIPVTQSMWDNSSYRREVVDGYSHDCWRKGRSLETDHCW